MVARVGECFTLPVLYSPYTLTISGAPRLIRTREKQRANKPNAESIAALIIHECKSAEDLKISIAWGELTVSVSRNPKAYWICKSFS